MQFVAAPSAAYRRKPLKSPRATVLLLAPLLLLGPNACGPAPIPPAPTQTETAWPTAPHLPTPTPTPSRLELSDAFDTETGYWETFPGAQIRDGIFVLGPLETWGFTTCLACGYLPEYEAQVEARPLTIPANAGFGLLLRFVDDNGNGLPDREDYYLDFEINVYFQSLSVFEKRAGEAEYTPLVHRYEARILPGGQTNRLRAVMTEGGVRAKLFVNDESVEVLDDLPSPAGQVGFVVGEAGVEIAFDHFSLRAPP